MNRSRFSRILAEAVAMGGVQGGSDAAPEPAADAKPAAAPPESKADPDVDALRSKLAAAEAKEEDRKRKEKAAADKRKVEEGKATELLTEKARELEAREKELADLRARMDAVEKRTSSRADAIYKDLPDATKAMLAVAKGKVGADDWLEMVEKARDAAGSQPAAKPAAPAPKPSPGSPAGSASMGSHVDKYEPTEGLHDRLRKVGQRRAANALEKFNVKLEQSADGERNRFHMDVEDFIDAVAERTEPMSHRISFTTVDAPAGAQPSTGRRGRR